MRRILIAGLLVAVFVGWGNLYLAAQQPEAPPPQADKPINLTPAQEAELKKATRQVLCNCGCSPTLLDDCMCGTARQIKDRMKQQLLSGMTPKEIVAAYIEENGERFLAAPPKKGFDLVIWIFPIIAAVVLGWFFWVVLRRLTPSRPKKAATDPAVSPTELSAYEQEIEQELHRRTEES